MSIFLLETIAKQAQELLEAQHTVQTARTPEAFTEAHEPHNIKAIITRGVGQIHPTLLDHFPNLQVVARCGVGLDNIDIDACKKRGISIINAPGATTIAVAEQTFYLMLACVRNLNSIVQSTRNGDWAIRNQYSGDDLCGKTLGLIGYGDIAQRVAIIASSFGMNILFWNHRSKQSSFEQVSLDHLFAASDILSVHVALSSETRHIINKKSISLMKNGAYLINTARGPHIDQEAVLEALNSGKISGFASDVFDPEPAPVSSPLLIHPNSIITPHISALTASSYNRMSVFTAKNVAAYISGNPPEPSCLFHQA